MPADVVQITDARRRREEPVDPEARPQLAPPPHDLEAERAVLSALILSRAALDVVLEVLSPEHFYDPANGRVYQAAQALAITSTPVDAVTLRSWLAERDWLAKVGGTEYLGLLCDASPDIAHVASHAETVLKKWEDRQLLAALQRHAAEARRPEEAEGGRDAFRARARASLGAATAPRVQLVGMPMGAVVAQARAELEASWREKVPTGIAWPFRSLDDFGLLQQGTQEIITGRPGMGKTGFTFQLSRRIVEAERLQGVGEAVYWCSWEMKPHALVMREAANAVGLKFFDVQRGRVSAERWDRFGRMFDRLAALPIWWDDKPCEPDELAARVRRVKGLFETGKARREAGVGEVAGPLFAKCRMRLVAIDQLSKMPPPSWVSPRADTRERVGVTAEQVREKIAVKLNVCTLLLAQLARPKDPRKVELPALSDLRESGRLEEAADGVTAIHRRQYYERGSKCSDEWRNVAEVLKLKGRYGESDDVRLGFYRGKFSDRLPPAALGEPHYETHDDDMGDDDE